MRHRFAVLLFAVLVVLTAVPASAAEPDASQVPDLQPTTEPTPPPDPTAAPTPAADPSATPAPDPTAVPDPSAEPVPAADPTPPAEPDPTGEPAPSAEPSAAPDATPAPDPAVNGGLDVTGEYIVVLRSGADTAAVVDKHERQDGIDAGRTFTRVVRAFTADLDTTQRRALLARPERRSRSFPTRSSTSRRRPSRPASHASARGSRTVADINGSDQRVDADVAIVDTGIGPHPGPEHRRRLQLLDIEPGQLGATRTGTARTSPARSPRSTTTSASWASRRAPACGPSGSSTPTATASSRGTSAGSTGSSRSAIPTTRRARSSKP